MTKRDILTILMVGVLLGVFLGYAWRMVQIEPIRDKEVELLTFENRLLQQQNRDILGKLAAYETIKKRKMSVAY